MENEYVSYVTHWDDFTFREFMIKYDQDVWNYAYYFTKNKEMSNDISQDVFLKVYDKISSFRGECSVKTWLLKITRNTAINYCRAALFRKVTLHHLFQQKSAVSAEHEVFDQMAADRIWEIVLQLSRKLREVLILDAKYNLSVKEIAKLLSIPEGTVKSRLARARNIVTEQLKEESCNENL